MTVSADETSIAGLGVSDDGDDARIGLQGRNRLGDRSLEFRGGCIGSRRRPKERNEVALASREGCVEAIDDGRRLRGLVEPAARAQLSGGLRGEDDRAKREQKRKDGDRATEAIDERSPA